MPDNSVRSHGIDVGFDNIHRLYLGKTYQIEAESAIIREINSRAVPMNLTDLK